MNLSELITTLQDMKNKKDLLDNELLSDESHLITTSHELTLLTDRLNQLDCTISISYFNTCLPPSTPFFCKTFTSIH